MNEPDPATAKFPYVKPPPPPRTGDDLYDEIADEIASTDDPERRVRLTIELHTKVRQFRSMERWLVHDVFQIPRRPQEAE